jgi:hypothetical protein
MEAICRYDEQSGVDLTNLYFNDQINVLWI